MTSDLTPERARAEYAAIPFEGPATPSEIAEEDLLNRILAAWERDRARLATVTAWVDALVPLAEVGALAMREVMEDGLTLDSGNYLFYGHQFGAVTETRPAQVRPELLAALAAIRAERATTGGTDADA
jgi:hypothetical protein